MFLFICTIGSTSLRLSVTNKRWLCSGLRYQGENNVGEGPMARAPNGSPKGAVGCVPPVILDGISLYILYRPVCLLTSSPVLPTQAHYPDAVHLHTTRDDETVEICLVGRAFHDTGRRPLRDRGSRERNERGARLQHAVLPARADGRPRRPSKPRHAEFVHGFRLRYWRPVEFSLCIPLRRGLDKALLLPVSRDYLAHQASKTVHDHAACCAIF